MRPTKEWVSEGLCNPTEPARKERYLWPNLPAELERAWKERCQTGNFSPAILGSVHSRDGQKRRRRYSFPRIASLDALSELAPDEQYAVQAAQAIVTQARNESRTVFAVAPGQQPVPVSDFQPDVESLMIVARIAGGRAA